MQHKISVQPLRIRGRSTTLDVETLRVVGYKFVCSCGLVGARRASHRDAAWEGRWHARRVLDEQA